MAQYANFPHQTAYNSVRPVNVSYWDQPQLVAKPQNIHMSVVNHTRPHNALLPPVSNQSLTSLSNTTLSSFSAAPSSSTSPSSSHSAPLSSVSNQALSSFSVTPSSSTSLELDRSHGASTDIDTSEDMFDQGKER